MSLYFQYLTCIWQHVVDWILSKFHIYLTTCFLCHKTMWISSELQHCEMSDVRILSISHIYSTTCCLCHKTMWLLPSLHLCEISEYSYYVTSSWWHVVNVIKQCVYYVGVVACQMSVGKILSSHIYLVIIVRKWSQLVAHGRKYRKWSQKSTSKLYCYLKSRSCL